MATAPPLDIELTDLAGDSYALADRLTTFPMAVVVVDPYTYESSWILDTARRIFAEYAAADVRVCFCVTADTEGAASFLGPVADEIYFAAMGTLLRLKPLPVEPVR